MDEQKQKLLRAEQSLQACQTKEEDLRKKVEVGPTTVICMITRQRCSEMAVTFYANLHLSGKSIIND